MTTAERPAGKPWTLPDAADYLGIGVRTIYTWQKENRFRTIRLGRLVKIPDDEVRRLATSGFTETPAA